MISPPRVVLALLLFPLIAVAAPAESADICVYGGTSGGVIAAVQAARMGRQVILLEPGGHLGGMTSGGLSAVDIGDPRTVGGLAREYFTRLVGTYGKTLAWDRPFEAKGAPGTGGAFAIEPHVAERIFNEMAAEAKVKVLLQARLAGVRKEGARIAQLTLDDGRTVRTKVFIDATYEGDLMAKAGVSYTLRREGNAQYGETYNGIHYAPIFRPRNEHAEPRANGRTPSGQGVWDRDLPLDPYIIAGDPKSGLLPLVQAGEPGTPGEPAEGVQAYCFRLCLTTAADRLPIAPPPAYDAKQYELVARFIAACVARGDQVDLRWFSKYDALPNDKWDFNTATFGGNLPGASWEWPEAGYARRAEIAKAHENYHRGLLHFLATDPRVPEKVRTEMARFGLPRDEFESTGGWPHQLYIREGRRMVSDLVMTEHHTFGREVASKPVSLGSYGTDTHEIRRIVKDGVVTREGKTAGGRGGAGAYPIGYGAIVPKAAECENLLVTFALSASHTAFSSIRMEPVFMVTSQSAATAASLAIEHGVAVQKVDYADLAPLLRRGGAILIPASSKKQAEQAARIAVSPLAPAGRPPGPPHPPAPEPVLLAHAAPPADVDGKAYDLIVVGGTGGGVACAVRAAREGCTVLLVQHNGHLGGMMTNGLMQFDALFGGPRAPLFTEFLGNIERHYRDTYGDGSPDHQIARYTHEHYPVGWAEPHVAEREYNRLVAAEKNITLLLKHDPVALERMGALLGGVTLREAGGSREIHVRGAIYADATYEGDLLALAKVPYRVGREARDEFHEPHAGQVFTNTESGAPPAQVASGQVNIRGYGQQQGALDPAGPFTADGAVQAFNYRFCVTKDPANRIMLTEPPPHYDRAEFLHYDRKGIATNPGPNFKSHMNSPILPGENHAYPEASWPQRDKITERHLDFALGLIWFLQNDESVQPEARAKFREWGLPKDEFADHGHIPYEMYVREARRLVGRHVYSELDNSAAPGLVRAPLFTDSVAVTDWYMDSHPCTKESRPGFHYDGKLVLTQESRPGQIPYRSLLPQGVDNLLVPVCLSATHVAWGAVRLEPVWMQTGESAGFAAALAKREHTTPGALDPELLIRTLAERRVLISFFNDVKCDAPGDRVAAALYFGTKGFFAAYDAKLDEPLHLLVAQEWARGWHALRAGTLQANELAHAVAEMERQSFLGLSDVGFFQLLENKTPQREAKPGGLTRGEALEIMWQKLAR